MRGSRKPKTTTMSSGCSVVRTRKYGSSRRATVTSRRRIARKTREGATGAKDSSVITVPLKNFEFRISNEEGRHCYFFIRTSKFDIRNSRSPELPSRQRNEQRLEARPRQM